MQRKHVLWIFLFSVVFYIVGNWGLTITDPVESNYCEATKEMLAAGEWFSPIIFGNYWFDKPIFMFWELLTAFKIFGVNDFAARLFPALLSFLGLLLTYYMGCYFYDSRKALFATLILGLSAEYWYIGHAVITDGNLLLFVSVTLFTFYRGCVEQKYCWWYVSAFSAGLAVLTKGPIGVCLPGLIALIWLAWERNLKVLLRKEILIGFVIVVVVAGSWYYPMYKLHGEPFIKTFFGVHNTLRMLESEHPRHNVWYFYILVFLGGFFPWTFAMIPGWVRNLWQKKVRFSLPVETRERFLWTWAVVVVLVFTSFATKYLTYTFPYMIPVAFLMADYFMERTKLTRWVSLGIGAFYLVGIFFIAPPIMLDHSGRQVGEVLAKMMTPETVVYVKGRNHSSSLTYYTGISVARLVAKREMAGKMPGGIDWNATNVMPFAATEEVPWEKDVIILTREEDKDSVLNDALLKKLPIGWEETYVTDQWTIMRARKN